MFSLTPFVSSETLNFIFRRRYRSSISTSSEYWVQQSVAIWLEENRKMFKISKSIPQDLANWENKPKVFYGNPGNLTSSFRCLFTLHLDGLNNVFYRTSRKTSHFSSPIPGTMFWTLDSWLASSLLVLLIVSRDTKRSDWKAFKIYQGNLLDLLRGSTGDR